MMLILFNYFQQLQKEIIIHQSEKILFLSKKKLMLFNYMIFLSLINMKNNKINTIKNFIKV